MNFRKSNINTNMGFERRYKRNYFLFSIKLLILLFFVIGVSIVYSYTNYVTNFSIKNEKYVSIDSSDSFSNLGNKIEEFDNVFYRYYIKNNIPAFSLKEGNYKLEKGFNIEETLKALDKPIYEEENITLLEGWNIFDIDYLLTNKGLINEGEYINYVNSEEKIEALSEFFPFLGNQITLEGYLYPDTYKINVADFRINEFVIQQLENFEIKVYNKLFLDENNKKLYSNDNILDVINLSSIVEKEERNPNEKSTVAGILKKRLNSGWNIGADITVCYPHELTSEECKMVVTKYISEVSEYNTRTMTGLPKTPIGNPSFETINATLNDKETSYWFYLHNVTTGKIYYATTNAEHERNKALYMR